MPDCEEIPIWLSSYEELEKLLDFDSCKAGKKGKTELWNKLSITRKNGGNRCKMGCFTLDKVYRFRYNTGIVNILE